MELLTREPKGMESRAGRSTMRALLLGLICTFGPATVPSSFATTDTGTQNPDLTVSSSLLSDGPDPDVATLGDRVSAAMSITNDAPFQFQEVNLRLTLVPPDGKSVTGVVTLMVAPRQTLAPKIDLTVSELLLKGVYKFTVEARNHKGSSTATAAITLL